MGHPIYRYQHHLYWLQRAGAHKGGGFHWAACVTALFAATAAGGAIYAGTQVREAKRARIADATNGLAQRWSSPEFEETRRLVASYESAEALGDAFHRYLRYNSPEYYVLVREPNLFENLGVLAEQDKAHFSLIKDFLGSVVVDRWDDWKPAIQKMREFEKDVPEPPQLDLAFSKFEALAARMSTALREDDAKARRKLKNAGAGGQEQKAPETKEPGD